MWKRLCPTCNQEIQYHKKDTYNKAKRLNRNCLSCSNKRNRSDDSQRKATQAITKKQLDRVRREFPVGRVIGGRTVHTDQIKRGEELGKGNRRELYLHMMCECGRDDWVRVHSIRQGRAQLCPYCKFKGNRSPRFIGYLDMPGTVMSRIKGGASVRKHTKDTIEFDSKFIYELFEKQGRRCKLSGVPLDWKTASLDRLDSSKGYTKDNVQWVHSTINKMKLTMSDEQFISWCNTVTTFNNTIAIRDLGDF